MKAKIKEVSDYFKSRLLNGEFEIVKRSQYTYTILIDGEYEFCIWMTNEPQNRTPYDGHYNFMHLQLTTKEAEKLHSILKDDYKDFIDGADKEYRRRRYEELKKEFGE